MAVDLFIMSQGNVGNKMKEFFFSFQGVTEPLKIINDYIYKREGLKRIKYDESA